MSDVEDVHMESQAVPMSLETSPDIPPTKDESEDSGSEYSGDEPENDENFLGEPSDDVDAFPFAKVYNRLCAFVGSGRSRESEVYSPPVESPDDHEYNFSYPSRGLAVIINNEKFHPHSKMSVRHGSYYDATDLERVYKHMGFKVKKYNDLTGHQMVLKLKKIAANLKYDHTKADCFACAILSHGDAIEVDPDKPPYDVRERQDVVFGVDGMLVPTKYILNLFNDHHCYELAGKPKLFFIQACRGDEFDDGIDVKIWKHKSRGTGSKKRQCSKNGGGDVPDAIPCKRSLSDTAAEALPDDLTLDLEPEDIIDDCDAGVGHSDITISPSPIYKDFLVMYSSPPGYFAWRRSTGAWLIQSLKTVIMTSDLHATSLTKLLTMVSRRVAIGYESKSDKQHWKHGKKQVPCVMSMLTKDVYFRPKK